MFVFILRSKYIRYKQNKQKVGTLNKIIFFFLEVSIKYVNVKNISYTQISNQRIVIAVNVIEKKSGRIE